MTAGPVDISLDQAGTFNLTYYKQGANFSGNYVVMKGVSSLNTGSVLFLWSTSGGQITTNGSSIVVKATPLLPYPSGTSGLSVASWATPGVYDMKTVTNSGSDTDYRLAGQYSIVQRYS